MLIEKVGQAFRKAYNAEPGFVVRAPGRVNLLGEHVDYNDGWVLPAAVDLATYLAVHPCDSKLVSITAPDVGDSTTFRLTELESKKDVSGKPLPDWARYAAGVAWALKERGLAVTGMDAVLMSDVPRGAGLSSSAAMEVVFALAWQKLSARRETEGGAWELSPMDLAYVCQRAEVDYVGVKCGIMDQFASTHGLAGHALLLDCRTLAWEPAPLPADVTIVVADTKVRRALGESAYNERRAQCQEAVSLLRVFLPHITALRDVSVEELDQHASYLPEVVRKRARHVVEECARTLRAVVHLKKGEITKFGVLMKASHASLKDLYEVSIFELDTMAEIAWGLPGCYGARLTGAGFGGCTVNLVARESAAEFSRRLAAGYEKETGIAPEIYVCAASDGAAILPGGRGFFTPARSRAFIHRRDRGER